MAVLFAASEMESFAVNAAGTTFNETGDPVDSNFGRAGWRLRGTASVDADFAANAEVWVHHRFSTETAAVQADQTVLQLIDTGNPTQAVLQVDGQDATLRLQYWDGAAFQTISTSAVLSTNTAYTIDVHCKIANAGGRFAWYLDGVFQGEFTGDTLLDTPTTVDRARFQGILNGGSTQESNFSEVIVTDTDPTTNWRLATLHPTADGNDTAFTGTFADIDESGINDDVDFIDSVVTGQVSNFVLADLSATADNFSIKAVVIGHRSRRGASGLTQVRTIARVNSVNYQGGLVNPGTAFVPLQEIHAVSPDTSNPWTIAEVNALQAGVESAT